MLKRGASKDKQHKEHKAPKEPKEKKEGEKCGVACHISGATKKAGKGASKTVTVPSKLLHSQFKRVVKQAKGNSATLKDMDSLETDVATECPIQLGWEALSKWLQNFNLRELKLPAELDVTKHGGCPPAKAWGHDEGINCNFKRITVKHRFSSRKMPHLLEFENENGEVSKFLYKQDDDITIDVVIMKLFKLANEVWKAKGIRAHMYTYEIVACPDKTGFGQIIPGDTMFKYHAEDIHNILGTDQECWTKFHETVIGVAVTTAIFDITDRHHNNVMFTTDGQIALIDLSASLGYKAPMDAGLAINPVYLPNRLLALTSYYNVLAEKLWGAASARDHYDFEEEAMAAYYALYNDVELRKLMQSADYKLLKPHVFLKYLHERPKQNQYKESLRNDIVKAMDDNKSFNKFVAGLTAVIPMN